MASDLTPDDVRRAEFKTSLRGLDRSEVEAFLQQMADHIEFLEGEQERLRVQLSETGTRDLESEFEKVGQEVGSILQAARDAAESMRERASLDSARWRSEAMADAEEEKRTAAADAEALRRDAWTAGTEILKQTEVETEKMRQAAERDVLTTMGEAEREAHRLTSSARREFEDLQRNATMAAEKTVSEATKRRDQIIDQANRQAAAAQERTRALELRRDELLAELENVRATLTKLEGSLDERREGLSLPGEGSSVKVVPSQEPRAWEVGETVRVVKSEAKPSPEPLPDADVEVLTAATPEPEPTEEPPIEPPEEPPPLREDELEATVLLVEEAESEAEPPERRGELDALFASLRAGDPRDVEPGSTQEEAPPVPTPGDEGVDWIEERGARLLPITNRALRGIKKAITDLQNIALDGLRTDEDWRPDPGAISEAMHAELTTVWAESFAAGHSVAEEMTGDKLKRPRTPRSSIEKDFAKVLSADVSVAIEKAGSGQRARQSAASKVYRIWRADEAERRIREAAIDAFEQGIEKSISKEAPVG